MRKAIFMASAAVALASVPSAAVMAASPAKFRLPPPTAPKDQVYSPAAIAKDLEKRGYRIEKMKRKGTTYSITATGPRKNKVQMTVDGRSGDIVGLAVLQAAANLAGAIAAIVKSGKGSRYIDDSHPFGVVVPDIYQTRWTSVTTTTWSTYTSEYVTESWSGAGYRFAVPYNSIRPGYGGLSQSTFEVSELREPLYDVYDYEGTEISTEYSEEMTEISEATNYESTYEAQDDSFEASYLGGGLDSDEMDADEVADYDSEDGDFNVSDDGDDGYDADVDDDDDDMADDMDDDDDGGDDDQADDMDDDVDDDDGSDDDGDEADEPDDDGGDDGDYDDGGDDGGDDDSDDEGGDEPEMSLASAA